MATPNLTYLFFDTKDYSGTSLLSSYSLSITPLTFIPDFTTSALLSGDAVISNKKVVWNFGDGTYSNSLTAVHQFKWPGVYRVKLTIFDNSGNAFDSSYQPLIYIYDFVNDQIAFADFKRYIYDVPASKIIDPLVIRRQNSWQSYNALSATGYSINLYASGASGDFIDLNNYYNDKWSHLRSNSRFYSIEKVGDNLEYVIVDSVKTKDKEIYARINNSKLEICNRDDHGSCFAGTTGYAEFYYVDDRVKNFTSRENPIFIFATADNKKFQDKFTINRDLFDYIEYPPAGFQNLEPAVMPIIKVRHNPATKLTVTTTGIDGEGFLSGTNFNIPYISWQNTAVPFVVKMKDEDNFTTKTYPPLSSSQIEQNIPPLTSFDLKAGILYFDTNTNTYRELSGVTFNSDFTPDIPRGIGAFYKGSFSSKNVAYNCKLTASMVVADPSNYPKDSIVGWIAEPQHMYIKRFLRTQIYDFCKGHVSLTLSAIRNDYKTPECPESYCIAVAPSGANFREDYLTWIGDGNADRIYKIDILGNILSAFSLSSYPVETPTGVQYFDMLSPVLSSAAPNSIAINSKGDAWVSLFDSTSVIKINRITGNVTNICYPHFQNLTYILKEDYNLPNLSGFAGENSLLPASIDTDYKDNLWVAYTHPASNFLVKYDDIGTMLSAIPFNWSVSPVEIVVDRDSNIWLTAYNLTLPGRATLSARNDFVYKFTPDGKVATNFPVTGFRMIGNITVDSLQNAWVFHDRETITKIDRNGSNKTNYVGGSGNNITTYEQSIGGIAMDTSDYLWVINSVDKKMYFIDTYLSTLTSVSGIPQVDLIYPPADPTNPVSAFTDPRFQAYGDWLGSRWINKYMIPVAVVRTLTGESTPFNIYPSSGEFNITKINENFDANNFYNDIRYQEVLLDKTVFFDDFIGTIVGKTKAQPYELGKTIFEKIANYVSNNADIDKCNLEKLISFCNELSVQFEEYNYPFPPQLRRLIDLLTIKHKLLFGETNKFISDFDKKGTNNPNIGRNLGSEINILTGSIKCGVPIVAYELFSEIYSLVNLSKIEGYSFNQFIPLSTYNYDWGWGLVAPKSLSGISIKNYYRFFNFINKEEGKHYNNIINWDDPLTLLPYHLSSFNDWSKNDGIMQNMISYELTKGLKLFLSGTNITYNN